VTVLRPLSENGGRGPVETLPSKDLLALMQALALQEKKAKREEEEKKTNLFSKGEWNKVEGVRGRLKAPPFAPNRTRRG
jgi:hypothetical protein